MTRSATPRLAGYLAVALLGMLGGIAGGRPELVAVAAPAVALLVAGLAGAPDVEVDWDAGLDRPAVLEGETVELTLTVRASGRVRRLDIAAALPAPLVAVGVQAPAGAGNAVVRLAAGQTAAVGVRLRCDRWGAYRLGGARLHAEGPLAVTAADASPPSSVTLKVFPRPPALRRLLEPAETRLHAGDVVSRQAGEGVEFSGLRPYVPGDDRRWVNWRLSARSPELWVTTRHPERSSDVVLLLDTFAEARDAGGAATLDLAVRAAAAIADAHLSRRDRVGLLAFGGTLQWLQAGMGDRQRYRLLDSLLGAGVRGGGLGAPLDAVPPGVLPPQALVVALTPLLDERMSALLADLRARRFDVAVVEVEPEPFLPPPATATAQLARRVWRLQRAESRRLLAAAGVPVVGWHRDRPLAGPLAEVIAFRRRALAVRR